MLGRQLRGPWCAVRRALSNNTATAGQTRPPAIILGVHTRDMTAQEHAASLVELRRLGETLGYDVRGSVTQRRPSLSAAAVVGPGKLQDLVAECRLLGPNAAVLVDHEISPTQARHLEAATGAAIVPRTSVILQIFERHAQSREARLSVEMARLSYRGPGAAADGPQDREGGGVGGRGIGETQNELAARRTRDRIARLRKELVAIEREAETRRDRRDGVPRVAIVGYTNAGKSTVMRALTGSDVLVEDKLFATLDTTVRAMADCEPRVLVSDTVGFIRRLPHELIASFRSTLAEAREAQLLVHVLDASETPGVRAQQATVTDTVLREIGAGAVPRLVLLNKMDMLGGDVEGARQELLRAHDGAMLVSMRSAADVARLRGRVVAFFERATGHPFHAKRIA